MPGDVRVSGGEPGATSSSPTARGAPASGMTLDESLLTGEANRYARTSASARVRAATVHLQQLNPSAQRIRWHSQPSRSSSKTSRFNDMDKDRNIVEIEHLITSKNG